MFNANKCCIGELNIVGPYKKFEDSILPVFGPKNDNRNSERSESRVCRNDRIRNLFCQTVSISKLPGLGVKSS